MLAEVRTVLQNIARTRGDKVVAATGALASDEVSRTSLTPFRFSTISLPSREQFGAWRDFNASVVELSLQRGDDFEAEQVVWDLGSFVLTLATLPGAGRQCSWRHLPNDPFDHWRLVVTYPNRRSPNAALDTQRHISFRSLADPFEGVGAESEALSLFIPRDLFGANSEQFDRLPDSIPDTGLMQVLADYLVTLERRAPSLSQEELPNLVHATRTLVAACLAPTAERLKLAESPMAATLLARARHAIRRNLQSDDLGPQQLCRQLGVSRSKLYRLFEPLGGVVKYIHRQRLQGAHTALCDVGNSQHIVQIAENFGFTDASGFSRAFKQEFGYTPSEAREAAWGRIPPLPTIGRGIMSDMRDLGDLLRRLDLKHSTRPFA
jgi:AraC-like DNA-binding protein